MELPPPLAAPLLAAAREDRLDDAVEVLAKATASGQVASAVLHVAQRQATLTKHFGKASSGRRCFCWGRFPKPICVTALMRLFDQGEFQLDDRLQKFLPEFAGDGREQVTLRQVLTHVSGLPDQLAANAMLRRVTPVWRSSSSTRFGLRWSLCGFEVPVFEHGDSAGDARRRVDQRNGNSGTLVEGR